MIVTAALLEKGDIIKKLGTMYKVVGVSDTHVHLLALSTNGARKKLRGYGSSMEIGIRSHEKIELIEGYSTARNDKYEKENQK